MATIDWWFHTLCVFAPMRKKRFEQTSIDAVGLRKIHFNVQCLFVKMRFSPNYCRELCLFKKNLCSACLCMTILDGNSELNSHKSPLNSSCVASLATGFFFFISFFSRSPTFRWPFRQLIEILFLSQKCYVRTWTVWSERKGVRKTQRRRRKFEIKKFLLCFWLCFLGRLHSRWDGQFLCFEKTMN